MFNDFLEFLKKNVAVIRFDERILLLIQLKKNSFRHEFSERKYSRQKIALIAAQLFLVESREKAFVVEMTSGNKSKILFSSTPARIFFSKQNPLISYNNLYLEDFFCLPEIKTWKSQIKGQGEAKKNLESRSPDLNLIQLHGNKIPDTNFYWCQIDSIPTTGKRYFNSLS